MQIRVTRTLMVAAAACRVHPAQMRQPCTCVHILLPLLPHLQTDVAIPEAPLQASQGGGASQQQPPASGTTPDHMFENLGEPIVISMLIRHEGEVNKARSVVVVPSRCVKRLQRQGHAQTQNLRLLWCPV
jgi:hypothetical protein